MTVLVVRIPGPPVPWSRARRRGKRYFTAPKHAAQMRFVALCARGIVRRPLTGPVALEAIFVVAVPASWSKRRQAAALAGTILPGKKPDTSNLLKLVEDALNGIVWVDDAQIVRTTGDKRYGAEPHTELRIRPLETST